MAVAKADHQTAKFLMINSCQIFQLLACMYSPSMITCYEVNFQLFSNPISILLHVSSANLMKLTSLGDDAVENLQGDVVGDCQVSRIDRRTHPTERTETKRENVTGGDITHTHIRIHVAIHSRLLY